MKLDGTEKHTDLLTPFNAHEQVVRGHHTHSQTEGYQAKEYKHQEFPKAIDHDKETGEPIIQQSEKQAPQGRQNFSRSRSVKPEEE